VKPYLTLGELADELGWCTKAEVEALLADRKLPTLKLSEEETVVSRWALEAYQRRVNGEPPLVKEVVRPRRRHWR
jgi:hypothetical protein